MQVRRHATVRSFLDAAGDFLLSHEGEYFLMLGFCGEMAEGDAGEALLVTLEHGGRVIAGALHWPPRPLIVTRAPDVALAALVDDLAPDLAGRDGVLSMMAPEGTAERLAELWTRRTSIRARPGVRQRAFQLEHVEPSLRPCPGRLRQAEEADLDRVEAWTQAFMDDVGMPMGPARPMAESKVAEGSIFLWDDDDTVTMAAWAGPTPNGVRINLVYTPPELRGQGYATACVAALSQRLLDEGRRYCFLYTDLANPTSNSIYQHIGYRPVCDVNEYRFGVAPP